MKKSILGMTLVAATALAALVPAVTVNAETEGKTDVGIGFGGDSTKVPGPYMDNLSLVYLPTSFDFGSGIAMENNVNSFPQKNVDSNAANYNSQQFITVIDDRDPKAAGATGTWKLTAQLDALTKVGGTADQKLTGDLVFTVSAPENYKYGKDELDASKTDYLMPEPGSTPAGKAGSLSALTNPDDYVLGAANGEIKVPIGAATGTAVLGRSKAGATDETKKQAVNSKVSKVNLNVTGQEKSSTYTGKLDWKLSNAYGN